MVGTNNETIRQEALKNQWELDDLLKKGRVTECGMLAASEIKPVPIHGNINRAKSGVYSKKHKSRESKVANNNSKFICWKCEDNACPGYNKCKYHNECKKCKQYGHSPKSHLCKANKKSSEKHESKNNIKNIWSGIREIVNIRNPNSHTISQLKVGGKLINNPRDISNKLNEYFVNVGPTTEDSFPKTQNVSALKFMKERINYAFLIAQVSHDEVLDIINSLEYKATGPVSIPIKLLKLIPDLILVPLCNIINASFNTGVFPNLLKLVKVIPIHKGVV